VQACGQVWHGRWHRIAIAAIVEQSQVVADVGQDGPLTCSFAVNANIREGIRIFKTGVSSDPAQAGSIPVRLREPVRVRTVGATK
jgi:hypothetical protein